jgi:hypothetical protein
MRLRDLAGGMAELMLTFLKIPLCLMFALADRALPTNR